MSTYEDTYDYSNRVCPYCGAESFVESEDYSEDERVEECGKCGKKYHARDNFSVTHLAIPDCLLNNEDHDWQPHVLKDGHSRDFCEKCGELLRVTTNTTPTPLTESD